MQAIWQKVKADILTRPLISLLVFVTVATSSMLLTLALATLTNLNAPYDRSFEELNAAHLWLYFDRSFVQQRDVERIEALPIVAQSTGLRYNAMSQVRIHGSRTWVSLRALPEETPEVNRLLIIEGQRPRSREDELLVSKDLDDLYEVPIGGSIGIAKADGEEILLPVVGLAYNAMWDTYRSDQPPYVYVSLDTLQSLYPDESSWGWSVGLRLTDPDGVEDALAQIEQLLHEDAVESHTDWRDVRRSAIFGARLNFIFLGAFSFFTILATILVVASSIGSIVLSQYRQIGILKAIGFTQRQVLWLYVGQYLLLSFIGAPIGLLGGVLLSPLPLKNVAASLSTTFRPPIEPHLIAIVLTVPPGVVLLSTLSAAVRGAKLPIIQAIATGAEAPEENDSWLGRTISRLGLPIVLTLGVNEILANALRSLMTGVNLTLGVLGIVFGLTLNGTLDVYRQNPSLLGIVHDAQVTRQRTGDLQTCHLLERAPGVDAFYSELRLEAEIPEERAFTVRAVDGDLHAFPFHISEGRMLRPNTNEAIAGRGLLNWLDLSVGDEVTLVLEDRETHPIVFKIVGQYPEPANMGQMMMVSWPAIDRWVQGLEPRTYLLQLTPDHDPERLKAFLEPGRDPDLNLTFLENAFPDDVVYLQMAIFGLSVILIGIALINVFNTTLLAMQEKMRTIGILKTIGMTPLQVLGMFTMAAGFLGFLATLLGLPLGISFTKGLLTVLSSHFGFGEVVVNIHPLYAFLLVPLMIGVSILGSLIPGRWATRVSIVDVLRSE